MSTGEGAMDDRQRRIRARNRALLLVLFCAGCAVLRHQHRPHERRLGG